MRCPDCNRFVSLETDEPELDSSEINGDGKISLAFTVNRNCAECSQTLKSASFNLDGEFKLPDDLTDEQKSELEVDVDSSEVEESDGGRHAKNLFSVIANCSVKTGEKELGEIDLKSEEIAASEFDEQC